jgi:hypothetical protein
MDNMKFEVVVFDLRKYSTPEEIENIAVTNDISIDSKKVSSLATKYSKVFVDKLTGELFAVMKKGSTEVEMSKFCEDKLLSIKPSAPINDKIEDNFTIDSILDKITEKGIESLSVREKFFLKKNS